MGRQSPRELTQCWSTAKTRCSTLSMAGSLQSGPSDEALKSTITHSFGRRSQHLDFGKKYCFESLGSVRSSARGFWASNWKEEKDVSG